MQQRGLSVDRREWFFLESTLQLGFIGILLCFFYTFDVQADAQKDITFTVFPSKEIFAPYDTVIIIVRAKIAPGYLLHGNPLGPGGGRPCKISIISDDTGIKWLFVRKLSAKKSGPPFGEWVWTWEKETWFFCVGVVTVSRLGGRKLFRGKLRIDGLLCSKLCRILIRDETFLLKIDSHSQVSNSLPRDVKVAQLYKKSTIMMELRQLSGVSISP